MQISSNSLHCSEVSNCSKNSHMQHLTYLKEHFRSRVPSSWTRNEKKLEKNMKSKLKGTSFEVQEKNLHGKIFIAYVSLHMFLYYKCDYDGDIVISCYVFARMCVVQGLSCIGLYLVVTTAWHLAALWRMCLQHAFYFMFHSFCFSASCFNVSCFS